MEIAAGGQTARQCWHWMQRSSFSGRIEGAESPVRSMIRAGQSSTHWSHRVHAASLTTNRSILPFLKILAEI
jgi:hypothetical protein